MQALVRILFGGWGRRAAWVALVVLLLAQLVAPRAFDAPRFALFDLYARAFPRLDHGLPVVIVTVDDESLKRIGQWPWPRQTVADLVARILAAHPVALGLDILQPEPDRTSPEQWVRQAGSMPLSLRDAIQKLPGHDRILADAIRSGPVVVGIGGLRLAHTTRDTGALAPFRVFGAPSDWTPPESVPTYNATLRSIPVLDGAAAGHGVLTADQDEDGTFRRLPLVASISRHLAPSLDLELLRLTAQAPWIDLYLDRNTIKFIGVGPLKIPTQADGSVWVNFSPHDERRFVSAASVLAGRVDAQRFDQRIVIISASGLGVGDLRPTPIGMMSGTEIQAQLLENILDGRLASRPSWAPFTELALTLLLGLVLIAFVPLARSRWQGPAALLGLAILAALGFGLWWKSLYLVDVATPAIGQAVAFVALLGGNFAEADAQRRKLRRELEERKVAAARTDGELEAARRIQMGMLPSIATVAGDKRVDLDALMIPARQIGGDLYDFFKIDEDRLFISVGDVSGKGVPAALFMALGKSLCKSSALNGESDIAAIVSQTNAELSRDNPEMLFITLFAGILNIATGELQFCNAGHDPPYRLRSGLLPLPIATRGGPPLCTVDDFSYETETWQLERGDVLCVTTDGVNEAMTEDGELMGRERVERALASVPEGASARMVRERLHAAVATFVAGAEASDDLTILSIRWL